MTVEVEMKVEKGKGHETIYPLFLLVSMLSPEDHQILVRWHRMADASIVASGVTQNEIVHIRYFFTFAILRDMPIILIPKPFVEVAEIEAILVRGTQGASRCHKYNLHLGE